MARMHSRKRGKSGSTKPIKKTAPSWAKAKTREVELLIAKFAKEGKTSSQIGVALRDAYGIPDVRIISGKTITQIMQEKSLAPKIPEDLMALIKKAVLLRKHLEANHKDMPAKRGLQLTESKINRLVKYLKKNKKLEETWKYDPESIRLYIE
jgi:small subunit ribosomal protein S15